MKLCRGWSWLFPYKFLSLLWLSFLEKLTIKNGSSIPGEEFGKHDSIFDACKVGKLRGTWSLNQTPEAGSKTKNEVDNPAFKPEK